MSISQFIKEVRQRHTAANIANHAKESDQKTKILAKLATLAASETIEEAELAYGRHEDDARRYCYQCGNLARSGQCLAAKRGELIHTAKTYRPLTNILRHCECYLPRSVAQGNWIEIEAVPDPFEEFFRKADQAGIILLTDNKRWLQSIGFTRIGRQLLEQYIQCWIDAMNDESVTYKKQNVGRFAANTLIREELINDR